MEFFSEMIENTCEKIGPISISLQMVKVCFKEMRCIGDDYEYYWCAKGVNYAQKQLRSIGKPSSSHSYSVDNQFFFH